MKDGINKDMSANDMWDTFYQMTLDPEELEGTSLLAEIRTTFYAGMFSMMQWFKAAIAESANEESAYKVFNGMDDEIVEWVKKDLNRRRLEEEAAGFIH